MIGKGRLNYPELPILQEVILVEGLIANLINISQLCDQGFSMSFSNDKCIVTDADNNVVMTLLIWLCCFCLFWASWLVRLCCNWTCVLWFCFRFLLVVSLVKVVV